MQKKTLLLISTLFALGACAPQTVNTPETTTPSTDDTPAAVNNGSENSDGYDTNNGMNKDKTEILDRRDQQKYAITKIGEQYWMAENLNFATDNSADSSSEGEMDYGRAYSWSDAMNGAASSDTNPSGVQGLCPAGWHLPSDAEWTQMEQALGLGADELEQTSTYRGEAANVGAQLKSSTGWYESKNGDASSGFAALPGGYYDHVFAYMGEEAYFWTATEHKGDNPNLLEAWKRNLSYESTGVERSHSLQDLGFYVRCLAN